MRILHLLIVLAATALCFSSCSEKKKKPVYYGVADEAPTDLASNEIEIPFRNENGVKTVRVSINGMAVDMIFDTGCSVNLISIAEARYLWDKGLLTPDDYLGTQKGMIADGSITEDMVFNLREVIIDDKIICNDVVTTVSSNANAPLLLGNEINNRAQSVTIDNENNKLIFKLK